MKNFPSTASVSRREFLRASAGTGFLPLAQSAAGQSSIGRKLGVALCGLGNYARGQLGPALKLTQNCELRGVVTGSPEKGGAWAKEYGFPQKSARPACYWTAVKLEIARQQGIAIGLAGADTRR